MSKKIFGAFGQVSLLLLPPIAAMLLLTSKGHGVMFEIQLNYQYFIANPSMFVNLIVNNIINHPKEKKSNYQPKLSQKVIL